MVAYYNEWEPYAAQWLKNLIAEGHLPDGDVDERSITEVEANEIKGYDQHHFFAGIGGWALAARLAGVSESERIVTGSPPCQPFSNAGQRKGYDDDRHLAPHWLRLVATIRPTWVFGEQVAAAIRKDDWLDDLLDGLEAEGYATGAAVLPACSVGAPHIRQRLWVVARLADSNALRRQGKRRSSSAQNKRTAEREQIGRVADSQHERHGGGDRSRVKGLRNATERHPNNTECGSTGQARSKWNSVDWLFCRDEQWRPVESGAFPLADGVSGRVGQLRAYGNAIVPQVAAEIIKEVIENAA